MKVSPPFGYGEIVPLTKTHRVKWVPSGSIPDFCREVNALPVSFSEFYTAARDYPIVFISGDEGKTFTATIVLGLQSGQNLFAESSRGWAPSVYVPAYVRRYPFCMARINVDNVPRNERVVCVENQAVDEQNGELLFDEAGKPLPKWTETEKFLQQYEVDLMRSEEMCNILRDFGLLEPFSMQAMLNSGGSMHMSGMYRVNEKNLEVLTAEQCRTLIKKGIMGRIYAHFMSLENFARLLDRSAAASSTVTEAKAE